MKARILVADDEPALRDIFVQALTGAGHDVVEAPGALAALRLIGESSFDLVVSDIVMPEMDGLSFLRQVHESDLDLPVILVTGQPTLEGAIRALEYGAVTYLVKPVSLDALEKAVARALLLRQVTTLDREAGKAAGSDLAAQLSRALENMWMAYQPIVRAEGGVVYAYEALLRTREPSLPTPEAILEAAEKLGRLAEVGRRVREKVAEALPALPVPMFLNLHPLDLGDDGLLSKDDPLIGHASRLVLEVTERAALATIPDVRSRIVALRDLGYRIAVDDLGAGYAGLSSFTALEPDVVKLDIALVRGADHEPVKRKLIGTMVSLCRDLGMQVVAEGVESEAESGALAELGCDLLQGFYFGRPSALEAIVSAPAS